ncbi:MULTISPECIES: hypothetical protein [Actinomadura]|uniref:hypothetical protein n=1 Tax=Actinomadura TaxID=1988 RepID=UPI00040007D5|nr:MULTISPECIES: hypothetical protein [Actinomadura]RSN67518.1 hypothetical protein DMH08_13155 [Actinomadura sp. WAC 06369]
MAFPHPGPHAPGTVVIRLRPFTMLGRGLRPPVLVDAGNWRGQIEPGDTPLPLPPGVWPVHVWCSYYGIKVGKAELTVDTRAGHPVLLHYAPPHTIYTRGALAFEPVDRPGKGALVAIFGLSFGVVALLVLLAALLG